MKAKSLKTFLLWALLCLILFAAPIQAAVPIEFNYAVQNVVEAFNNLNEQGE